MLWDLHYPEPDPNKKPAAQVWDQRYSGENYLFGKEPALLLKNFGSHLKKGKTLDVAMGEGRNAVYLASQGFEVEGLDASKTAVEKAKKLAESKGVSIDVKSQNLDFFIMPLMKYDSIIMTYYRPVKRFYDEIRRGLVVGGTAAIEAYTVDHYKLHGSKNEFLDYEDCFHPNELLARIKELQVLYYNELAHGDQHLVQLIVRKRKT